MKTPTQAPDNHKAEYGPAPPREKIQPAEADPSVEAAGHGPKKVPSSMSGGSDVKEYVWHYLQEDGQKKPEDDAPGGGE